MISLGVENDDGDEERDVEHHHDKDWNMEEKKHLISCCVDEAGSVSYPSMEV